MHQPFSATGIDCISRSVVAMQPPGEKSGVKNLLPVEKNGNRLQIAECEIFCVRANGRHTSVFNGRSDFFCPLSISEFDRLLLGQFFFRCHRSYIVNLAHVRSVKKVAEAGVVELDSPLRRAAPITRGRVAALREALHAFRSGAKPPPGDDLRIDAARPASGSARMAAP